MHTHKIQHDLIIHALPSKVWKVLTSSDYARQFLFNEELRSDWMKGSPIVLDIESNGITQSISKGTVQEVVPGISMQYTLYELPEFAESAVCCSYELAPEEGGIRLIISQELELPSPGLYQLVSDNCQMMLQKIKWLAEYC
ncbi:MAG TPA: SRPBCC domain-containing protein [Flavisolibacter sp.]|nr:SRPBCC domain-containing protein [Flavisolibacter sp.]